MILLGKAMNEDEKLVAEHLSIRGFSNLKFEPDGNHPPDFVIDGGIAIEVRKLNQNEFCSNQPEGLEQAAIKLSNKIRKLLDKIGSQTPGESWFVFWRFNRPIQKWKSLLTILETKLLAFASSTERKKVSIEVAKGFELEIFQASKAFPNTFVAGGFTDEDSNGWLMSKMQVNIHHCVEEKTIKIAKYRHNYPHWWLILVDYIGYGLSDNEIEIFRKKVSIQHNWAKVILVNPNDLSSWFEV